MRIVIDTENPRSLKCLVIAADARLWTEYRRVKGEGFEPLFSVPSSSWATTRRSYFVTTESCTCEDFKRHAPDPCKHIMAVTLHLVMRGAQ
jgi:hypothetical protein